MKCAEERSGHSVNVHDLDSVDTMMAVPYRSCSTCRAASS
jgi:hypothetical protein